MRRGPGIRVIARWVVPLTLWLAALGAIITWSASTPATWAAVIVTIVAGAVVDRWPVALVPVPIGALLVGLGLLSGDDGTGESDPVAWALFVATFTVVAVVLLAFGVIVRDLAREVRGRVARARSRPPGRSSDRAP